MRTEASEAVGWAPLLGSYEEAVLSWHEQVEKAFAGRQYAAAPPQSPNPPNRTPPAAAPEMRTNDPPR